MGRVGGRVGRVGRVGRGRLGGGRLIAILILLVFYGHATRSSLQSFSDDAL